MTMTSIPVVHLSPPPPSPSIRSSPSLPFPFHPTPSNQDMVNSLSLFVHCNILLRILFRFHILSRFRIASCRLVIGRWLEDRMRKTWKIFFHSHKYKTWRRGIGSSFKEQREPRAEDRDKLSSDFKRNCVFNWNSNQRQDREKKDGK